MEVRMKRLLIGFGVMFCMQLLAAYLGLKMGINNPESAFYIMFGFTVSAYFGGGLAMGLLADRIIILEPIIAALSAVVVNTGVVSFSGSSTGELKIADVLLTSYMVEKGDMVGMLLITSSVLSASLIGSLAGERIAIPTYDWMSNAAAFLGLISLIMGPIFLLSRVGIERGLPSMPTPFIIIILLLFVVVVGIGYILFTKEPHEIDEISISPNRKDLS